MANLETITCDVAKCGKPFAYRVKGFNLCAEHCFDKSDFLDMVKKELVNMRKMEPFIYEPVSPYVDVETGEPVTLDPEDDNVLVACEWDKCLIIGCTPNVCSVCGIKVGLSPSSMALLEQAPKITILCMDCIMKQVES